MLRHWTQFKTCFCWCQLLMLSICPGLCSCLLLPPFSVFHFGCSLSCCTDSSTKDIRSEGYDPTILPHLSLPISPFLCSIPAFFFPRLNMSLSTKTDRDKRHAEAAQCTVRSCCQSLMNWEQVRLLLYQDNDLKKSTVSQAGPSY